MRIDVSSRRPHAGVRDGGRLGLYRHIRNPMYLAVILIIVGQAILLGRLVLLAYAAGSWLVAALFVRFYEEPALSKRFGDQYAAYRRAVRPWWPRLHRWSPDTSPR